MTTSHAFTAPTSTKLVLLSLLWFGPRRESWRRRPSVVPSVGPHGRRGAGETRRHLPVQFAALHLSASQPLTVLLLKPPVEPLAFSTHTYWPHQVLAGCVNLHGNM